MDMKNHVCRVFVFGAVLLASTLASAADQATARTRFDDLLRRIQREPGAVSAAAFDELLEQGEALGRPVSVSAAARMYLAVQVNPDVRLLRRSAEAALMAGDLRTAVARYRQSLHNAVQDADASLAAARLATILIDYLNSVDEGYRFLADEGVLFRGHLSMRRFDTWFMDRARERNDYVAMARHLVLVMEQKLPYEMEFAMARHHLDWLMTGISSAQPVHFPAAAHARRAALLMREDGILAAKYRFIAENLTFKAASVGKEAAVLKKEFDAVVTAARAYIDAAPVFASVRDVMMVFSGGINRHHGPDWEAQEEQKRQVFVYAFGKLPEPERMELMGWTWGNMHLRGATADQWAKLGQQYPDLFKRTPATVSLPFVTKAADPSVFKAQSGFLSGVPSESAAIINSLAAGGTNDLYLSVKHLFLKESWHLNGGDIWKLLNDSIRPVFFGYLRPGDQTLPERYFERIHYRLGHEYFSSSPWALMHPDVGRGYVLQAWSFSGATPDDKSKMPEVLRSLDWVAYTEAQRRSVFGPAYDEFKKWVDETGKLLQAASKADADASSEETAAALKKAQGRVALATVLEAEFKKALDPAIADPTKAPDPLAQQLSRVAAAVQANDQAAFNAAAKAAYAMVRDYETKHIPFGRATVDYLLTVKPKFDVIDWQSEVLADRMKLLVKDAPNRSAHWAMSSIIAARGWNFGYRQIPAAEKDNALKINDVLAKALHEQMSANWIWPPAFSWFRTTRIGHNWHEKEWNEDVLEKLIEKNILLQPGAPRIGHGGAVTSYQWMIRNEFQSLNSKFPVESAFDDLFVEEMRSLKHVDMAFFHYSQDKERKVSNAITEWFSGFDRLPFLRDQMDVVLDRDVFWQAQGRIWSADPAVRATALQKMGEYFGKTRFDDLTTGRHLFNDLPKPENGEQRIAYFVALKAFQDRVSTLPWRVLPPKITHLDALGSVDSFSDTEIALLKRIFTDTAPWTWPGGYLNEAVAQSLAGLLVAKNRANELFELIPVFWKISIDTRNGTFQNELALLSGKLSVGEREELGAALAVAGIEMLGAGMSEGLRSTLQAVRAKSLAATGALIPVERADPRYPIYAAQAAYAQGKPDNAWEQYRKNRGLALRELRNLNAGFSLWLVEQHTAAAEYGEAEALVQSLIMWMDGSPQAFDPQTRSRLLLAVADIAFTRQEYPRARAQYERLALAKDLDGTAGQRDAELRIAEVDRLTRSFDRAVQQLERLVRHPDPYLQAQAYYQLALVRFDQENYADSRDYINQVFVIDPSHALARILEGRLYLQMRKLVEATDVKVGLATDQQVIVPGRPLKVQIEDRTLAVVGSSLAVEIRAWTDGGDEEFFNLLPFGDSKTRFEGQIPTRLGTAAIGDRVLQVRGGDTVHYDFSVRFKTANKITGMPPASIRVVSDAELFVSSGEILTREEEERQVLESMIRGRLQRQGEGEVTALGTRRSRNEIKPGNPIHVRVVDPDRSVSAGRDTVMVRAVTSSGDRVDRVALTESTPDSGVFEGKVPTASAPATAFASDSEEGRDPNFAISGGDYPAWIGLWDNRRPKIFSVDLNSNVHLAEMKIVADEPLRSLRQFVVQTSPNGQDFFNAGVWPPSFKQWNGGLRLEVTRLAGAVSAPGSLKEWRDYMDIGYLVANVPLLTSEYPAMAMKWASGTAGGHAAGLKLKENGADSWFLGRVSGYFRQPYRQFRTFRIDHDGQLENILYFLTINGQQGSKTDEFEGRLDGGMHRVDVWFAAQRDAAPAWTLLCDSPEPPYMVPCPTEMFSVEDAMPGIGFAPAKIETDTLETVFTVLFPEGTQARMIRLWLLDFEREAPAIRRLMLNDNDGNVLLPTKVDLIKLRSNDVLEVIPGDRVSLTYEDPSFIDKSRKLLEAGLTATFHNGKIHACFVESTVDGQGNRLPRYVPMRRYRPGDAVSVFIHDPDMDTTSAPDRVKFKASVIDGSSVELEALETENHSGVFIGRVFPVEGPAQRPAEITVGKEEDLVLVYRDEENTVPGIPWERRAVIDPVVDVTPRLYAYDVTSHPLSEDDLKAALNVPVTRLREEYIPVTRSLAITRRPEGMDDDENPSSGMHVVPLVLDLIYPTIVLSPESTAELYLQTTTGRQRHGLGPEDLFDPQVPGTVRLRRMPGGIGAILPPSGYKQVFVRGNLRAEDPLDEGRFSFVLPIALGPIPDTSGVDADKEETGETGRGMHTLQVRGDDDVYAGFRWKDTDGVEQWIVKRIPLRRDVFFDVMDQRYRQPLENLFVGQHLFLRIMDPARDLADGKDVIEVNVRTISGRSQTVELVETFETSGIFKGVLQLVFDGDPNRMEQEGVLPVQYGDTLTLAYSPGGTLEDIERTVTVFRGADGKVFSFTKRFADPEIAVQTQFTIAEAYFEQAKKYRELKHEDLARDVIAQGRRLLDEAIREHPATEARAQAEYLLAELALEYANDAAADPDKQQRFYMEAIGRFSDIVALYPDGAYAPKAQYKKALTFEKMGQIDEASGEYVKLSYRYPDHELVAETIARLGQYFLTKGREMQELADAESDLVKAEIIRREAIDMYRTSAEVFGRLAERFPNHHLAGRTLVLSAQSYMRALEWRRAIHVFEKMIADRTAEPDLIAQSMYWAADCYMKDKPPDLPAAYRLFKRLTWDYPESQWAKYARGRLTDEQMVRIEEDEEKSR